MSQNERLLNYLNENHTINPLESWNKLGIYRLSARIKDLRDKGHNIESTKKQVRNQFGEKVTVAEYSLWV